MSLGQSIFCSNNANQSLMRPAYFDNLDYELKAKVMTGRMMEKNNNQFRSLRNLGTDMGRQEIKHNTYQ